MSTSVATEPTETIQTGLGPRFANPHATTKAGAGTFSSVPTISLASSRPLADIAAEIRHAAVNVGFFYISDHGIPLSLTKQTFEETHRFFHSLTLDQKQVLDLSSDKEEYCGYWPVRLHVPEGADGTRLLESIMWPYDPTLDNPLTDAEDVNKKYWPSEEVLPGFRARMQEYEKAVLGLGRRLMTIFALALRIEENYFDRFVRKPGTLLSLNHYPAEILGTPEGVGAFRAHSDYECFTILLQDNNPSLEVVSKDGAWIPVPPVEGTFVVNIGDTLSMWTNDLFLSTVHRAYNKTGKTRYSIPYFFGADYDALLETIPTCITEGRPQKYEPITSGAYVKKQLALTYKN